MITTKNIIVAGALMSVFTLVYSSSERSHAYFEGPSNEEETFVRLDTPEVDLQFPLSESSDPTIEEEQRFNLDDPENVERKVEYDPVTGKYQFSKKIGGKFDYRNPSYMESDEYREYNFDQAVKNYWKAKVDKENIAAQSNTPKLNVKKDVLSNPFGNNFISIRPQGTAEISMGFKSSTTENPQLPEDQRSVRTFDFQERIQLNVLGQIGDKLQTNFSYNTEATFDFENQIKLEYAGKEDEILQKLEAGNVSLPLNGSLITGSQSLFGIKSELKFGKLTATLMASQQRGRKTEIDVAGGAQKQDFKVTADSYEANRHFFVSSNFLNNYDRAMASLPIVNSQYNITRIEVWVTNRNSNIENTRNIIAFADLGEVSNFQNPSVISTSTLSDNDNNNLYAALENNTAVREFNNVNGVLSSMTNPGPFVLSSDYEKLQGARMLKEQEYAYNAQLGFISLNAPLNQDEVLGVSYQYTYNGKTYQVGEFSTDGISGTDAIVVKLLKGTNINPNFAIWDLMMKNVYAIGAYQVSQQNFVMGVWYNNPATSVDINYIPRDEVNTKPLVQLLNLDNLNVNNAPYPDGVFDFAPLQTQGSKIIGGGTINPKNGRVYFTTVEPFGSHLKKTLLAAGISEEDANSYVFQELYDSTKTAAQQIPEKNRFSLKGTYESSISNEIPLNAINVPKGSVTVTAGGRQLAEGSDYTVDYNLGRVRIINQGLLESQTPIKVSLESNELFGLQQKSLIGTHLDYRVNKDFNLGGTFLNLSEKPLTAKIDMGEEPISNSMLGFDGNFRTDAPFLTKWVDKLPLIETKEKSSFSIDAEYARLIPGNQRAIKQNGGTSYVDDFEGSQSSIDLKQQNQWQLASIPQHQPNLFPEGLIQNNLSAGYNRAKIAWYQIDRLFHKEQNTSPKYLFDNGQVYLNTQRQVLVEEVFSKKEQSTGDPSSIPTFDLAYYPEERGPYNYDALGGALSAGLSSDGKLNSPESRWGGIMRQLTTTNFENANIEFIQFWVMDPFNDDVEDVGSHEGGDLYINLGNISEDILPDARKSLEGGLPSTDSFDPELYDTTNWAVVPVTNQIVNAFATSDNIQGRTIQDVGFDGMNDALERAHFNSYLSNVQSIVTGDPLNAINQDPSGDNYNYYRDDLYDNLNYNVLQRYKNYNGQEGNSPTSEQSKTINNDGYLTQQSNIPNIEDINSDNNLSETESYFQYKISLKKSDMVIGRNYITNISKGIAFEGTDNRREVNWYQFKIPVRQPDGIINNIQDFRSIRFMRMFMKGVKQPMVLRFARLELLRGEWRSYLRSLEDPIIRVQEDPNSTNFSISAVNIEENSTKEPVQYVIPEEIQRERNANSFNRNFLNEQSLVLSVDDLKDGDSRAAYRNVAFDVRSYKKLRMFVHGEAKTESSDLVDNDVTVFIRLGTDFENNYYEYELPVKLTPWGSTESSDIWPEANNILIEFNDFINLKRERNLNQFDPLKEYSKSVEGDPEKRISVKGNPNLQGLKTIMIGVHNPANTDNYWGTDDGLRKSVEVWVNELRLTDFNNEGGWAARASMNAQLADFANVAVAGSISTPNFGSIEKKVSERQRETNIQFDASSNIELGKFFGDKSGIKLPMFMGYSEGIITPQFDPLNPDILFTESIKGLDPEQQASRKAEIVDVTKRKSLNFTNIRKERSPEKTKSHFYDVENLGVSYSYSEIFRRNINTLFDIRKDYGLNLNYSFNSRVKPIYPFKKNKVLRKSKWLRLIKDFNFYPGPKQLTFNSDLRRTYGENQVRITTPGAIQMPVFVNKQFTWNRTYGMKYDLTKGLKLSLDANNNSLIEETIGRVNKGSENYQDYRDTVWNSIQNLGKNLRYAHNANLDYKLPLDKLPLTDWITVTTRMNIGYDWERAPLGQDTLGNVIQNSRNFSVNGKFTMSKLYNKVGYLKKVNQKFSKSSRRSSSKKKASSKVTSKNSVPDKKKKDTNQKSVLDHAAHLVMALKSVRADYSVTNGTLLPGFDNTNRYAGMDSDWESPGWDFVLGRQFRDLVGNTTGYDIADVAYQNNWMIDTIYSKYLNRQYTRTYNQKINLKATLEPIKGMRVDLVMERTENENFASNFKYSEEVGDYAHLSPQTSGTLNMTTISWKTAFDRLAADNGSAVFDALRSSRTNVSRVLSQDRDVDPGIAHDLDAGYYKGFGEASQDVVIGAFLTSYLNQPVNGKSANPFKNTPLPNWTIRYDGLSKIKFLKKHIRNLNISHGYRSNLRIANYTTNLEASVDPLNPTIDQGANYIADKQILNLVVSEQFAPLIGIDATWNIRKNGLITKFEYKQNRNLALNLGNNQIIEMRGKEFVIGTGYTFNKIKFPIQFGGKKPTSDLKCRADLSFRDNVTITRYIVEGTSEATSGQKLISLKTSADYILNNKLTMRFYYDRVVNDPKVRAFKSINSKGGISLRFTLTQ